MPVGGLTTGPRNLLRQIREAMAGGESWSEATRKFAMAREGWPGWRCLTGL